MTFKRKNKPFLALKKSFFTIKKKTFWKSQKSLFSIGVNPCFWSKNANFFVYVDLVKITLEIMLVTSHRKKKPFGLYIKTKEFFKVEKNFFFYQGFNPGFWSKSQILLYLDLFIITLERLLSDFAEKKETCFDYKKRNFSKSKKSTFPKGLTHAFGKKMPIIWFI